MGIERRIALLEANEQPARYFVAWPDAPCTEAEIASWRAVNPHGVLIRVEYRAKGVSNG